MISCERIQKKLAEEGLSCFADSVNTGLANHVTSCAQCRALLEDWTELEQILKQRPRPDPGEPFWEQVWTDFSTKLPVQERYETKPVYRFHRFWKSWSWRSLAGVSLLLIGFVIGRMVPEQNKQIAHPERPSGSEEQLVRRVKDHLEQSKLLLLGFVNMSPQSAVSNQFDFSHEKELSGQLIVQSPFLQDALVLKGHQPLQELLLELEIILLQISNLASDYNSFDLELVRDAIEQGAFLYKINLQEMTGTAKLTAKKPDQGRSI